MVQGDAVVDGVQAVAGGGDDEVIAEAAVPAGVGTGQPNPPVQDLQCGLAGALVVVEAGAGGQGNQGLSQCVLVPAVHGVRAGGCRGRRPDAVGQARSARPCPSGLSRFSVSRWRCQLAVQVGDIAVVGGGDRVEVDLLGQIVGALTSDQVSRVASTTRCSSSAICATTALSACMRTTTVSWSCCNRTR